MPTIPDSLTSEQAEALLSILLIISDPKEEELDISQQPIEPAMIPSILEAIGENHTATTLLIPDTLRHERLWEEGLPRAIQQSGSLSTIYPSIESRGVLGALIKNKEQYEINTLRRSLTRAIQAPTPLEFLRIIQQIQPDQTGFILYHFIDETIAKDEKQKLNAQLTEILSSDNQKATVKTVLAKCFKMLPSSLHPALLKTLLTLGPIPTWWHQAFQLSQKGQPYFTDAENQADFILDLITLVAANNETRRAEKTLSYAMTILSSFSHKDPGIIHALMQNEQIPLTNRAEFAKAVLTSKRMDKSSKKFAKKALLNAFKHNNDQLDMYQGLPLLVTLGNIFYDTLGIKPLTAKTKDFEPFYPLLERALERKMTFTDQTTEQKLQCLVDALDTNTVLGGAIRLRSKTWPPSDGNQDIEMLLGQIALIPTEELQLFLETKAPPEPASTYIRNLLALENDWKLISVSTSESTSSSGSESETPGADSEELTSDSESDVIEPAQAQKPKFGHSLSLFFSKIFKPAPAPANENKEDPEPPPSPKT